MIEKNADVDKASTDTGSTPLFAACQHGRVDCTRLLIENNAEVDKARTDTGATPLLIACHEGHVDCARLLIESKAGVNKACTENGVTPLFLACSFGQADCARLLIENGADFNASVGGFTPLCAAYASRSDAIVQLFLRRHVDISHVLFVACEMGDLEIVRRFLDEEEVDIDRGNAESGATALSIACAKGTLVVARLLIKRNADVDDPTTSATRRSTTPVKGTTSMW